MRMRMGQRTMIAAATTTVAAILDSRANAKQRGRMDEEPLGFLRDAGSCSRYYRHGLFSWMGMARIMGDGSAPNLFLTCLLFVDVFWITEGRSVLCCVML